jgi:uncharacterized protein YijF (DUF1287 family)
MKKIAIVSAIFLTAFICIYAVGYHGQRDFPDSKVGLPPAAAVVAHARKLAGTPYDPLMGRYGNIGAKAGLIVCSDVPNIAYGLAGFSLQRALERDYKKDPSAYDSDNGNKPGNPFFHRRARNLYAYFRANGMLLPPGSVPHVADLVFYSHTPNSYISHVALVTELKDGNYSVMESAPETILAREVSDLSIINRGWKLRGFGRMYVGPHDKPIQTIKE